ncbi:MAG: adenylate/guanylate cyclase domain-containing protein [Rhizobiales bacterium]|nr:adenylate/guanylate cyclase domain-containing protein [Hyphomicrobiales bacterium]
MTLLGLAFAWTRRGPSWLPTVFVGVDALLVVILIHEHLFAKSIVFDHRVTAPTLAVGLVLLTHVALRLQPKLVLTYAGIVLAGWLGLLVAAAFLDPHIITGDSFTRMPFSVEVVLAAAFGFAAVVCWLMTNDHDALLKSAVNSERRRATLSRFFSPIVLSELQMNGGSFALNRRRAGVMFVDLRSFTRFSENVDPEAIAELLTEYRKLVTDMVFAHGGTIDKFIGDGVMVAFGAPPAKRYDAARALRCALSLSSALSHWKEARQALGKRSASKPSTPESACTLAASWEVFFRVGRTMSSRCSATPSTSPSALNDFPRVSVPRSSSRKPSWKRRVAILLPARPGGSGRTMSSSMVAAASYVSLTW